MDLAAVVINVGTDAAATLALASLQRHAPDWPVTLLNCEPSDASRTWFASQSERLGYQVIEAPVRQHGDALDDLFRSTTADVVLLLDSDAEILQASAVERALAALEHAEVFGAGFTDGPAWAGEDVGASPLGVAYFQERPWMPFTVLRTATVKRALDKGLSFRTRKDWTDLRFSRHLSALVAARLQDQFVPRARYLRALPRAARERLATAELRWLDRLRADVHGTKASYVIYDTGAEIFQWAKHSEGEIFAGYHFLLAADEVVHYGGLTRAKAGESYRAFPYEELLPAFRSRLVSEYSISFPD